MTKKDYILVSKVLKDEDGKWSGLSSGSITRKYRAGIASALAEEFYKDNSKFDLHKFYEACGICACGQEHNADVPGHQLKRAQTLNTETGEVEFDEDR